MKKAIEHDTTVQQLNFHPSDVPSPQSYIVTSQKMQSWFNFKY